MSVAFALFHAHPAVLEAISERLQHAIARLDRRARRSRCISSCMPIACIGLSIVSQLGNVLTAIDNTLGELGVDRIVAFVASIRHIFFACSFNHIDIRHLRSLFDTIINALTDLTDALRSLFGHRMPSSPTARLTDTDNEWTILSMTASIRHRMAKLERHAPLVERLFSAFERLYAAVRRSVRPIISVSNESTITSSDDTSRLLLDKDLHEREREALEQINDTARLMQSLETTVSYGILLFRNEEEILAPLASKCDECSVILETYAELHFVYKVTCGVHYLSSMRRVVSEIGDILLASKRLKLNTPHEFIDELKHTYPDLLLMIFDTVVMSETIRKGVKEILPPALNKIVDSDKLLDKAFGKIKGKIHF